jgi:hypothetical protein
MIKYYEEQVGYNDFLFLNNALKIIHLLLNKDFYFFLKHQPVYAGIKYIFTKKRLIKKSTG